MEITDARVRKAWLKLDRKPFVPGRLAADAARDAPLPIGFGQTISQPSLVAYMTQCAEPQRPDRALEIGTGSGYQTALLAALVRRVYTIETVAELASAARTRLDALGYRNIEFHTGDGYAGWPAAAPFDIIMVTAAAQRTPPALLEQLSEGGRMLIPLGPENGTQELYRLRKIDGMIHREALLPVRFVPFVHTP